MALLIYFDELHVVDSIQILCLSKKRGRLTVRYSSGDAIIYFEAGEIKFAKFNDLTGVEAIWGILSIDDKYPRKILDESDRIKLQPPYINQLEAGFLNSKVQTLEEDVFVSEQNVYSHWKDILFEWIEERGNRKLPKGL
jgi:hypothetical protein